MRGSSTLTFAEEKARTDRRLERRTARARRLGRALRGVFLAGSVAALVGCANSWPVFPGDAVALGPLDGLLVVHVRTNAPLGAVHAGRTLVAEDVPVGEHLQLIGIRSGSYRWSEILLTARGGERRRFYRQQDTAFEFRPEERLYFRVEPGSINYVGMLDVQQMGEYEVYMTTIDRTAIAREMVGEAYPDLSQAYPFAYNGPAHHVFLERHRAATRGANASGSSP